MSNQPLKSTPAPWRWEVNKEYKTVYLRGGCPRFDQNVMSFTRWGMGGAAPEFRGENENHSIMHRVEKWASPVPGREHHAHWFMDVNHPDARLIAAAPDLLWALKRAEMKLAAYVGVCTGDKELIGTVLPMIRAAITKAEGGAK